MHGVADNCSLNGGFRLDVANTRLSEFSVPLLSITHVLRSCGYRSIRKRLGVRVFLEDGLSVLDGPDHRGISGKFSTRRFVPSFVNFCTRTALYPKQSKPMSLWFLYEPFGTLRL
jgi:hypothetical protein